MLQFDSFRVNFSLTSRARQPLSLHRALPPSRGVTTRWREGADKERSREKAFFSSNSLLSNRTEQALGEQSVSFFFIFPLSSSSLRLPHHLFFAFALFESENRASTMGYSDAPSSSSIAALAAALAAAAPAPAGNGTQPKPSNANGGGGICIDLVSPHTPRGVVFNNLVRRGRGRRNLRLHRVREAKEARTREGDTR